MLGCAHDAVVVGAGGFVVVVTTGSMICSETTGIAVVWLLSSVEHEYAITSDAIATGKAKSFVVMGFMCLRCSTDRNCATAL